VRRIVPATIAVSAAAAALLAPVAADASTPTHALMAQSTCASGPGYVAAIAAPAADGTTNVEVVGHGLRPAGTWHGSVGSLPASSADFSALTQTDATVSAAGALDVTQSSTAPWGSAVGGGVFASPDGASLCDVFAGSTQNIMLAENSIATLMVKASGAQMGVAIDMVQGSPGSTWRFVVTVKAAGKVQHRTVTTKVKRNGQPVRIKGIGGLGSFKQATVTATNLSLHRGFKLALAKR
jgi:hypothetical protein